ncbi:TPA: DNA-binding protein [Pseudomonas aeruginosa]|uniref:DNA-binding protein n=1 Tax=Pseudomonas aeruginosa TaxID=287 RepID=UPI001D53AAD0|nr:DNA-binding protein [Pseudomonas aeruginosa]MBX6701045.1 DNA-binding protein [Pseudomonas aeruginosa]WMX11893.1 DNA-binding protein [Pseudomonas aeruginosa]HCF4368390.1 DNA-binding protein [Pseudomonas aeruginosa]HCF4413310.1 DNA-binding protein [Pseudomonas aeruginosa]HCF6031813.1 DNA-binding protein [Pseudomonas aeruginosa]
MSRVGITKEEVRQAIAQLRNQGSPVTVRSIQAITGGSYSTVQRFWKDLRDEEIEMLGDGGRIQTELQALVHALHDKMKENSERIVREGEQRCEAQIKEMEEVLDGERVVHQATVDQLAKTEGTLADRERLLGELTERLNSANIELGRLAQELTDTQRNLEVEKRSTSKLTHDLQAERDAHEHYLAALNEQRRQEQATFDNALTSLREDNRTLSADNIQLRGEILSLNKQLSGMTSQLTDLQAQNRKLALEADSAKDKLQVAEQSLMNLRIELATVKTQHSEAERQLESAVKERRETEEKLVEAKASARTQNSEVRRLSAQLEGMKAELSSRVQSAEKRGAEGNT